MLSLTLFEIFVSKYSWATNLTFQVHVTSPVKWLTIPRCNFW